MFGFLSFLGPYRLLIEVGAVTAIAISVYFYGYSKGSERVQAQWDKAEQVRKDTEQKRAQENQARAHEAATHYEAAASVITERHVHVAATRKAALLRPIAPPASAPALGDVRIPDDVVNSLRAAAGDTGIPSEPAASGPSSALQPRARVPSAQEGRDDLVH